jgi:hypothetical protein
MSLWVTDHPFIQSNYTSQAGKKLDSCLRCGKIAEVHIRLEEIRKGVSINRSRWQTHCPTCNRNFESYSAELALALLEQHLMEKKH